MYGGAAGGGKTEAILWEAFSYSTDINFRNLKGAIFRKTYPEIEKYFIKRALDKFPAKFYRYNKKDHIMYFPQTGSQIEFNHCESDQDVTKYQGAEWDWLAIDEFTHHTEFRFKYLFGRMRTDKAGWKTKFFGGSNPGDIGHAWVKRIFIDNELVPEEMKFTWGFIPARLEDNPKMLEFNPQYEDQLLLIPDPVLRKALRWGDWNIFAGQFFSEIRSDIHGFEPFQIPRDWMRFIELDYGYDHPAVAHWNAVDGKGEMWKYKELVTRMKTYTQFATMIIEMVTPDEKIDYIVGDPAIWAKKGAAGGLSGAEEMQNVFDDKKILLMPGDNDRLNGWGVLREWFKVYKEGDPHTGELKDKTRMHVSNALKFWWKKVPELQRDPKKPEDVLKNTVVNADGTVGYSDDSGDATRYGVMSRPAPNAKISKDAEDDLKDRYGQPKRVGPRKPRVPQWTPTYKPEYKGLKIQR